jgi:hypothetical protein
LVPIGYPHFAHRRCRDNADLSRLRQKPLPTLAERRQRARTLFKRACDRHCQFVVADVEPEVVDRQKRIVKRLFTEIGYLGAPDRRLDLYRTFDLPLPPPHKPMDFWYPPEPKQLPLFGAAPEPPKQLGLPLPLPKPKTP